MSLPARYSPEQLENVQKQAAALALSVGKLVGEDPILMVATLTMAACHAALLSDTSYEDLETLFKLHYESAALGLIARDVRDGGAIVATGRKPEGSQ